MHARSVGAPILVPLGHFIKTIFHQRPAVVSVQTVDASALNFKPNYLAKKFRLNRFVKNSVRKPIRSRFAPPATFPRGFCSKTLFGLCEIRLLNKYSFFSACSVYSTLHCFLNGCPVYFCRGHGRGFIAVFIMSRVWPALFRLSAPLVSVTL